MEGHIFDIVKMVFSMKTCLNRDPKMRRDQPWEKLGGEHEE